MSTPLETLQARFGYDAFRPGQAEVIDSLMAGRSAAAVFPTGSGKSLCYQLPALLLPGLTLVVSPLIALMKDQIDQLKARGISAERLDSTLSLDEYRSIMQAVRSGSLRMLYVAPERFNNERFREATQGLRVSLFAVDEAHCISEWGHNFRPDYLKLAGFAKACKAERVLALTATAPPQVLDDICRGFEIAPECAVRTGFYRPNLTLLMTSVSVEERSGALLARLKERETGPTIVYVTLQRTAEEVAGALVREGIEARHYHAGMASEMRAEAQEAFLSSDRAVVVATIAFGMGIDKSNIRYVYHYNLPKSLENLSQEIGRAGRDGLPAVCETLVCLDDLNILRNFAYGDTPSLVAIQGMLEELLSMDGDVTLNLYGLAHRHDIRQLVVRTLLTYLEIDGYLKGGTPSYASYRFRPLASSDEILSRFEGERREFLSHLFRQAKKAKTWFDLDPDQAARALGHPRQRVVRALDYLAEQGLLEVRSAAVRHHYRWLDRPTDPDALAETLYRRTIQHEERELARLDRVVGLASLDGCQTSSLSAYFGETLAEPCGHCSWCLWRQESHPDPRPGLVPPRAATIDEALWQKALDLRRQQSEVLAEDRAFARFLTGVSSPRLSRQKLTAHPLFGCLGHVPFSEIFSRAEPV